MPVGKEAEDAYLALHTVEECKKHYEDLVVASGAETLPLTRI